MQRFRPKLFREIFIQVYKIKMKQNLRKLAVQGSTDSNYMWVTSSSVVKRSHDNTCEESTGFSDIKDNI